ncbi:hypothetical protein B7486_62605, partial [cyanobacterium TDX16]
ETTMNDGSTRYAPGQTTYCVGDQNIAGHMDNTTYLVRAPDDTPDDPLDNPIIGSCGRTFTGRNINSDQIWDRLRETTSYDQVSEWGLEGIPFRQHFRQWTTLCEVMDPQVGDYVVQVVPNTTAGDRTQSAPESTAGGHNRFALRAGFGGMAVPNNTSAAVPDGTGVQVEPVGHLVTSYNGTATSTTAFLARVLPGHAGQTMRFEVFDLGDVGSGSVSLQVLPPVESNAATFADCTAVRDGTPELVPTVAACGITGLTSASYNGRTITFSVPVPDGYTCDDDDEEGCWVRLATTYSGGAQPSETATITMLPVTTPTT